MKQNPYRVDVHHHAIPSEVLESFNKLGITEMGGVPIPVFDPKQTLAFMDFASIKTAVVSLSDVGDAFKNENDAINIAREANQFYASLFNDYPGRFGAFATLPLPYVEASINELKYALDTLQLEGVMMLSNNNGVYLGDPSLDNVMKELNKRKAVVCVHPTEAPGINDLKTLNFPGFLLDFVFDTTRAITNMIFNKTVQKYPDIKFIFAHMGGTAPYLMERIALGLLERQIQSKLPKEKIINNVNNLLSPKAIEESTTHVKNVLSSFYYDTALSSAPATISTVRKLAGLEHIVFGSDYKYAPEFIDKISTQFLIDNKDITNEDKMKIERDNALKLFPHLK